MSKSEFFPTRPRYMRRSNRMATLRHPSTTLFVISTLNSTTFKKRVLVISRFFHSSLLIVDWKTRPFKMPNCFFLSYLPVLFRPNGTLFVCLIVYTWINGRAFFEHPELLSQKVFFSTFKFNFVQVHVPIQG